MRTPVLLRRCTALLALACFSVLPAESLIPDFHDAALHDGATQERPAIVSPSLQAPALATLSATACHSPASMPVHATHVEHCAHGHGPALGVALDLLVAPPVSRNAAPIVFTQLRSLTTQPAQRPPTV